MACVPSRTGLTVVYSRDLRIPGFPGPSVKNNVWSKEGMSADLSTPKTGEVSVDEPHRLS